MEDALKGVTMTVDRPREKWVITPHARTFSSLCGREQLGQYRLHCPDSEAKIGFLWKTTSGYGLFFGADSSNAYGLC